MTDQESCQEQCELDNGCIGISYGHGGRTFSSWCYICMSDNFGFRLEVGFYGKPGKEFILSYINATLQDYLIEMVFI